ncbi:glycosyltransferase family 2 protein [Mangrovimonas cancribranchiae]|uniref:Glycosyltransferase family A protein n=1 Tax=Mangrovimonas cancribranchiae TaxID=3080055 RepID=A0AAU6P585_9FLAO
MTPFFSIIIPLYNKEYFVKNTITSILNQSFKDFEIIVVNDGSTDNSLDIVKTFKDQRIRVLTTKNQGVSSARNYGIKKANAKYIAFLDADDLWETSYLQTIHNLIIGYPKESIFASALKIKKGGNYHLSKYKDLDLKKGETARLNYFKSSKKQSILHCSSVVIKKTIFKKIGGFNSNLKTGEDTDLWIRIGLKYPVVFIHKYLVTHLALNSGLTSTNRSYFKPINFSEYENKSQDIDFKSFLNKNKFSSALKLKITKDMRCFNQLKQTINFDMLSVKQRLALTVPRLILLAYLYLHSLFSNEKKFF